MSDDLEAARPSVLGKIGKATPVDQSKQTENAGNIKVETHQGGGGTLIQNNQLSTPVLIALIAAMCGLGVGVGVSWGRSDLAEREAQNSERESRVNQDKVEELRVQVEVLKVLVGIDINKKGK